MPSRSALSARYPELRSLSVGEPNYGKALASSAVLSRDPFSAMMIS